MKIERIHPPGEAPGECFYEMDRRARRKMVVYQTRRIADELMRTEHPGPFDAEWLYEAAELLSREDHGG